MAGTILGKRNRASESGTVSPSSISSRVKRRAYVHIHTDEDASSRSLQNVRNGDGQPGWILQSPKISPASTRKAPGSKRAVLSPCKANGQARAPAVYAQEAVDENVFQFPTPKTPRHRDALSKKVPITPKHRIGLVNKPLTPRLTRTPSTPHAPRTVYDEAQQLFTRSTDPGQLIGRTQERNRLLHLLNDSLESRTGTCVYISGPPGTGKSALVADVCDTMARTDGVTTAYINCMSIKSSGELYRKLIDELLGDEQLLENNDLHELKAMILPEKKTGGPMYIVTLDEIDHLLGLDLEALYTLFEYSLQRSSRLIVVGIANALDLTDRFLPRLKAKNLKPQLLPVSPYTAVEISDIITIKLRTLLPDNVTSEKVEFVPLVHPLAIQLCSKKVASQTGDLRKAFDIIRRSIDVIKIETKQKSEAVSGRAELSPSKIQASDLSSPPNERSIWTDLKVLTAPRATIAHVSRISAAAFSNGTSQRLTTLNLQQKVALCALISHQKASREKIADIFTTPSKTAKSPPTIRQLHTTYSGLCRRDDTLHPLTPTEFADVVSGLEALGLVSEEKKGGPLGLRMGTPTRKGKSMGGKVAEDRRVVCFVDEKELERCLDGPGGDLLKGLLNGDA